MSDKQNKAHDGVKRNCFMRSLSRLYGTAIVFKNDFCDFARKESSPRNWGCLFLFISLLFFILGSLLYESALGSIALNLGAAWFAAGLFSIILGLREFIAYTTGIMSNVMIKTEFLDMLDPSEHKKLRFALDCRIMGKEITRKGPYLFLTEEYPKLYGLPYRTSYTESTHYTDIGQNSDLPSDVGQYLFKQKNTTSYVVHFAHTKEDYFIVPYSHSCDYYEHNILSHIKEKHFGAEDIFRKIEITIEGDKNKLYYRKRKEKLVNPACDDGGCTFFLELREEDPDTNAHCKRKCEMRRSYVDTITADLSVSDSGPLAGAPAADKDPIISLLPIDVTRKDSEHPELIRYRCSAQFRFSKKHFPEGRATVIIHEEVYTCRADLCTSLTLSYPTKGFTAEWTYPQDAYDYLFYCAPCCLTVEKANVEYGKIFSRITMNQWLLPGHGCMLITRSVKRPESAGQKEPHV